MRDRKGKAVEVRKPPVGAFIIASIVYIILGVFMVTHPAKVEATLCYAFGILMTIFGVINVISFFINKDSDSNLFFELVFGVLSCAFGVFTLVSPTSVINILFIVIGVIIIIDGIMNVKRSFYLKDFGERYWFVFLIISAVSILAGILTIVFRQPLGSLLIVILGINLIYEGISGLVIMFRISQNKKRVERKMMMIDADFDDKD